MITLSVERLREYFNQKWQRFRVLFKFSFLGTFTFLWQPELYPGISNHVRIYAPEGLLIRDVEFDIIQSEEPADKKLKELKERLNSQKENYLDDKCFYIQLGPEDSKKMHNSTCFNIEFGLRKKRFHIMIHEVNPCYYRMFHSCRVHK